MVGDMSSGATRRRIVQRGFAANASTGEADIYQTADGTWWQRRLDIGSPKTGERVGFLRGGFIDEGGGR